MCLVAHPALTTNRSPPTLYQASKGVIGLTQAAVQAQTPDYFATWLCERIWIQKAFETVAIFLLVKLALRSGCRHCVESIKIICRVTSN